MIPHISSLGFLASSPAMSSVTFNVSTAGGVTLSDFGRLPSNLSPATVTPEPTPTPTPTATVAVTEVTGTVKLDDLQFMGITTGLVLLLVFAAAIFASQLRRP